MKNRFKYIGIACITLFYISCTTLNVQEKQVNVSVPQNFANTSTDSTNSASLSWKNYFTDPYLSALIDTALVNNQELNIVLQEVEITRNEIRARKGEYLPFLNLGGGIGAEKVGRYTSQGANDANTDIAPGKEFPDPLGDIGIAANFSWEIDIWRKLRNAKDAAAARYLSSVEGKNFLVTQLIAEIANSYYELLSFDNQLAILQQNIDIQSNVLEIVKQQKQAGKVTELAVKRFEAQVLNTKSHLYLINQEIIETENKINLLVGRYPSPIPRDYTNFVNLVSNEVYTGIPSQLLENRPDVKQAEMELIASKLDIKVAKANFYPSLGISAGLGLRAFNPTYLVKAPESLLYGLAADMVGPIINRNAIKAAYYNANAKQIQAVYNYERTLLTAYLEVSNQLASISNLKQSFDFKEQEVEALTESINISNSLFRSARADYMEILITQRDVLESKFELIETKKEQMHAMVNIYKALGGGWR